MAKALNVVFLPTRSICATAIRLSQQIARAHSALFTLDDEDYHSHLTLFKVKVPDHTVPLFFARAAELIQAVDEPLTCTFTHFEAGRGYVLARMQPNAPLRALHTQLVHTLHHLRCKGITGRREGLTEDEVRHSRVYGHPYVLHTWRLHMTITRLEQKDAAERVAGDLIWPQQPLVTGAAVAIGREGDHGTCREILRKYPLSAQ